MANTYHNRITGLDAIHELMWIGSSDPAGTSSNDVQPHQFWLDTTGGATLETGAILKERNAGNTAWTTRADIKTALDLKAALASPTFTGTPAAPTAAATVSTTQLATTAFAQSLAGPNRTSAGSVSGAQSWNVSSAPQAIWAATLTGNVTLTISNTIGGGVYTLELTQDATGGRTVTLAGVTLGNTFPTLSAASKLDVVTLYMIGSKAFAISSLSNLTP